MSNTGRNFLKAMIWLMIAGLFGTMPFISLQMINDMSEVNVAIREINHLVKGAFIIFPCCAITGAVVADFIALRIKIKNLLTFTAVYILPFVMIIYLFSQYLLVYIQYEDMHDLGPGTDATRIVIAFTIIYTLAAKTYYYRLRNLTAKNTSATAATRGNPI
jgi:hypothetical protein